MLNSGSQLSYSLPFTKNIILEGEAWLDVKHDKNHPFKINAGKSLIEVLGTSLNLSAYPEENYIEIVLLEGNVEFLNIKEGEKISLLPSERLVYKDGNISKSFVDPQKYKAWTSGKMVFKNDPMLEVARRIERWYNVKVELADPELMKYTFRATFEDDKLENVMKFLCMTSPFKYKITPSELSSDGTFKKEKVTIYLNKSHI